MSYMSTSTLFNLSIDEISSGQGDFNIVERSEKLVLGNNFNPIAVKGHFVKQGRNIYINGFVKTDVDLICSRCGKKYKEHINGNFNFLFLPEDRRNYKEGEKSDLFFYNAGYINFADQIRDTVLLFIPMKPLCNKVCKGIKY